MNKTYEDLMNSKEIVQVKVGDKLQKGQLIGFLSSVNPTKISVAYPYFSKDPTREDVFNFVLFERGGKPVIDNDSIREGDRHPVFTNVEPIIVPVGGNYPESHHDVLKEVFSTPTIVGDDNNNYHKNSTTTCFQIADENWGMYHPKSFETEEEARKVIETEYKNRSKNDGSDDYWRNRKQVVLKVTKTIEVLG